MIVILFVSSVLADNSDCLVCHDDATLKSATGKLIAVNESKFNSSVHRDLECTDCHTQPGNFDDVPHFQLYRKVDCATCHSADVKSYSGSFHGRALARGLPKAPDCAACHAADGNPHAMGKLNLRTAENACRQCHSKETDRYDSGVHILAARQGKNSPGCISCHPTHSPALPPSTGAVNRMCEKCHVGSMKQLREGPHKIEDVAHGGTMSCASCHDVHATHKPHLDQGVLEACINCHPGYHEQFIGTVHQPLLEQNKMNCLSCHRTHQITDALEEESFGCGACHANVEADYRNTAHRMARLHGNRTAATCADCHGGHHIKAPNDKESPVYRNNIPMMCGKCHTDQSIVTADYVRLPISLPSYMGSVHGKQNNKGDHPAVCTDCHGTHNLQSASMPASLINRQNLSATCGQCHSNAAVEYSGSIHGRALALGIKHSPSCTDCHDEHLIQPVRDPKSPLHPRNLAQQTCARCHQDPAMAARYGLPSQVIESYEDSYHSWAIIRGARNVATCTDCHNTHDIRSAADSTSSIHKANVVQTCARCHPNSNAQFAASYTHILARGKLMIHDWVRIIYIWLIVVVLGGMFLHNLIIFIRELGKHRRKHLSEQAVVRMTKSEIWQHIILFVAFTGLAITGFALRYSDTWWVHMLKWFGMTEEARRVIHRTLAVILVGASLYHAWYLVLTQRGRLLLKAIFPKLSDIGHAIGNMLYYAGLRKEHPKFGMFDYTQKAEYWALIWGTAIMTVTGIILWFPALATGWLPAWVVRVCEVIHYYEAILAVSAIIIWHFFFTIFLPKEYPMSWTWLTGRMSKKDWDSHHPLARDEVGEIKAD